MCVIEKLASRTESPQTVSECSGSHDDSGHVSGGSQGTTPEHKRTDSNYSASSIPSTLSTVTDVAILARFALLLLLVIPHSNKVCKESMCTCLHCSNVRYYIKPLC